MEEQDERKKLEMEVCVSMTKLLMDLAAGKLTDLNEIQQKAQYIMSFITGEEK